jgi:hypothetical protein
VFDIRIITLKEPIKPAEIIQIRALEWLTFNKEQHREALKLGNTLCRRFLGNYSNLFYFILFYFSFKFND